VGEGSSRDGATVLLVEDDERIAAFLLKGLGASGFQVEWVATAAEGFDAVERGGVGAVLLDLGLPDVDGLEMLRTWHEAGRRVPVVVLTARSDPRDRARALSLGACAYLTKPAPFRDLVTAVRGALDRAGP
jgi:DNA-binding response OmpR family regulator